ncbi:MAG TPA: Na-translocating system protein MpsC family protein [Thermoleophilaceae bacterium]
MEGRRKSIGDARAEIATQIVRLHSEYYGRGPTKAKAYITEDVVVVVLEETFTKAERTLVDRGEIEAIQQIRRRFQQTMGDDFKGIVEQATGRVVRAFLSETNLEADVAVEFFLLGEERTDMRGFEPETAP